MDIVDAQSAYLCNHEVMTFLNKIKDNKIKYKGPLATVTYETLKYLEESLCKQQTPENIMSYIKDLGPFELTKTEKLMLVNTPPTSPLEIQLLIEDSEERLTEEQVIEILAITAKYFPEIVVTKSEDDQ